MHTENTSETNEQILFNKLKCNLLDPLAIELGNKLNWIYLDGLSKTKLEKYPIAITGHGPPILLLHGFDSSFLEFRRLTPFLEKNNTLFIPDLFGFGFCPRPKTAKYGQQALISHLSKVLSLIPNNSKIGLIGASMGGSLAMQLARKYPDKIDKLLLLSPAGLTGKPMPIPRLLDKIGVWFLKQSIVRKNICKQAFFDPINSVGNAEEQIASLHLNIEGWGSSLAAFARTGGLANCGLPLPTQPINVLWGEKDRILEGEQMMKAKELLNGCWQELKECGHLPHLDKPLEVALAWDKMVIDE